MLDADLFDNKPKVKGNRLNMLPENPDKSRTDSSVSLGRFPSWLHRKLPKGSKLWQTGQILTKNRLHTVCEEAKCPNLFECWSKKTATFLIMGKECTRSCGFCDINFSKAPEPLELDEPQRVAEAVFELNLKHVVITMVARDDLQDGGACHLAKVMNEIRKQVPTSTLEVLTSDFQGKEEALMVVLNSKPEVFNHNIETVRELTPRVRHKATYDRTLDVLRFASENRHPQMLLKSGLMVGLGETSEQVRQTIRDLKSAGCDIMTIGQYLQANKHKLRLKSFVTPEQFKEFEEYGYSIGMKHMYCGPFVRSSYNADLFI
jgi:lipoyl synthase